MRELALKLLGGFEVAVDGEPLSAAWPSRRAADLVKLLALSEGHSLPRDRVTEALWPKLEPKAGARNLHKAASYARAALGGSEAVVLANGRVMLAPELELDVDVDRFLAGDSDAYRGELLPDDPYEEWTIEPRAMLRDRYLEGLHGEHRWLAAVEADPADERAHRELIRSHAARGDRVAAIRQYRSLRDALAALGTAPGRETEKLAAEVSRGPPVQDGVPPIDPMLGREDELVAASAAVERALEGSGGALWISGDAGIGKSRLLDEAIVSLREGDWHLLRGTARERGALVPYEPVVEALDPLLEQRPELVARLSPSRRRAIELLDPTEEPSAPEAGEGSEMAPRMLAAIGQLLAAAAAERGLAVVFEDLHAADSATLALANYLARAARGQPMLVVLTARSDLEAPGAESLRARLLEAGDATEVTLGPLPDPTLFDLASDAAGPSPADRDLERIVERAAGNPLFAIELATAPPGELPGRLHELLAARLERARIEPQLLAALAVLDDGFEPAELTELTGERGDWVEERLERLCAARVLTRDTERFRLRHALLREAAAASIPAAALRRAHHAAAERLSQRGAGPERVAYHLLGAERQSEAVPLLAEAARGAARVGAYEDGRRWVERALEHADREQRADLLELLAELRHRTGDGRAGAAIERAIELAPEREPTLRVLQGRIELAAGRLDEAERALVRTGPVRGRARVQALLAQGMVRWLRGDLASAHALAAEAELELADGDEVEDEDGSLLEDLKAMLAHDEGSWREHTIATMAEKWQAPQLAGRVFDAYLCVTEYVLQAGEPYDELAEFASRLRDRASEAGAVRGVAFSETFWGEAELLSGRVPAARRHLADAARLSRQTGAVSGEAIARTRLAEALVELDDAVGAAAQLEEALDLAHASPLAHHCLYLAHGPLVRLAEPGEEAVAAVDRAEALLGEQPRCRFCPTDYYVSATEALARGGELDRARELFERAEASARLWRVGGWSAALAGARGELQAAEGDRPRAEISLRRAVEGFAAAGQTLRERRASARLEEVAA